MEESDVRQELQGGREGECEDLVDDDNGDDDEGQGDTSFDNFGQIVTSRGLERETGQKIPDFIFAKATRAVKDDILIGLMEIKRDDVLERTAISQMVDYMKRAALKGVNRAPGLLGFLVLGADTRVYQLMSSSHDAEVEEIYIAPTDGLKIEEELRSIATQYWN